MPAKPAKRPPKSTSIDSATDWNRLKSIADEDLVVSEIPEPTEEAFARAIAREGLKPVPHKSQITLRIDADVLQWFKDQGKGYQTRINALLRAFMQAHRD
jgi:uncharacterized protein (DUF4415 family)